MKVYCDRVAVVKLVKGEFACPKCNGVCQNKGRAQTLGNRPLYDCNHCFRGWTEVPDSTNTTTEADEWWLKLCDQNDQIKAMSNDELVAFWNVLQMRRASLVVGDDPVTTRVKNQMVSKELSKRKIPHQSGTLINKVSK